MVIKERNFSVNDNYRFGFNGKENDNDIKGEGNQQDYGMRIYDPRLGRFLSVDPLTKEYPELTPYQFASNTPVQAIDLDGLEAFIVHGTSQTKQGVHIDKKAIDELKRIVGNTVVDDNFRWNAPKLNGFRLRRVAAKELVSYIVKIRAQLMQKNIITEDEPISLIGYSHGGNVSIQAARMLNKKFGIKVNLITIGTPAKNSAFDTDSDNFIFGNPEDPQGNPGINKHFHIRHERDGVWKVADAIGDKSDQFYSNPSNTTNWKIPNEAIPFKGPVDSHTDLPSHPDFYKSLEQLPTMTPAPSAGKLEEKKQ